MANYHPRKFFRDAPNSLLQRYFKQQEVLTGLEWDKINETRPRKIEVNMGKRKIP